MIDPHMFLTFRFWVFFTVLVWPFFTALGVFWGLGQTHKGEIETWITGVCLSGIFTLVFFTTGFIGAQLVKFLLYLGV